MAVDHFSEALRLHKAGELDAAAQLYARVLRYEPGHPGALNLLGVLRLTQGRTLDGVQLMRRAVRATPDRPETHYNLGGGLETLGELDAAEAAFRAALRLAPDHAGAHLNLSGVKLRQGRPQDAFAHARRAAELAPDLAEPFCNAGLALRGTGFPQRAAEMFREALRRNPEHHASLHNLGNLLRARGDADREAEALFRRVLARHPLHTETRVALAQTLRARGEVERADAELAEALALSPDDPLLRLGATIAKLRPLYGRDDERLAARASYGQALDELDAWVRAGGTARLAAFADVAGTVQPFFLPYSGDDNRALQRTHGRLVADAMRARHGEARIAAPPGPGAPIRVGFVSGYMRDHSNWKIPLGGWMEGLDRSRFAIFGYHTGEPTDAITEHARTLCTRFVQGPLDTEAWRREITRDAPHVLIFPETGMDSPAFRLAAQRLAPLQCVSWGHPETSGLPTIDAFLTSDAMEPPDAERLYTERLVRLPGLGFSWRPPPPAPSSATRESLGLPAEGTLLFCGQSLYKYRPSFDALLARIAAGVPDARFVFVEPFHGGRVRAAMRARLASQPGLDADRSCVFLDRLDQADFVAAATLCDLVLDSPSWAGCNSTLECLAGGTPLVTLEGATLRARHGSAILRAIGVPELIARTEDELVALACDLAGDPPRRARLRDALATGFADWRRRADTTSAEALGAWIVASLASGL